MRKRAQYIVGVFCLVLLIALLVWQGSFTFGAFGPANPLQTLLFWAISTLIFLLTITLGFMLFRTGFKLYLERQTNRAGSRIRHSSSSSPITVNRLASTARGGIPADCRRSRSTCR